MTMEVVNKEIPAFAGIGGFWMKSMVEVPAYAGMTS